MVYRVIYPVLGAEKKHKAQDKAGFKTLKIVLASRQIQKKGRKRNPCKHGKPRRGDAQCQERAAEGRYRVFAVFRVDDGGGMWMDSHLITTDENGIS